MKGRRYGPFFSEGISHEWSGRSGNLRKKGGNHKEWKIEKQSVILIEVGFNSFSLLFSRKTGFDSISTGPC